jgi:RimJ/RimL family protein N-acetyltransferase
MNTHAPRSNRSVLRPWFKDDLESLVRLANNPKVAANLRDIFPHPYTRADAESWLENCVRLQEGSALAIEVAGEAAGGIGLKFAAESAQAAEIGFWLGESFWGRGVMSEALPAYSALAFEKFPIHELFAEVFAWNAASRRVFIKSGYEELGLKPGGAVKKGVPVDAWSFRLRRPVASE